MDNDLKTELAVFVTKVSEWMETTKSYREQLCEKIDKIDTQLSNHITEVTDKISTLNLDINTKLNLLPCRERVVWYQSIEKRIKWLWIMLAGLFGGVLLDYFKKK